MQWLFARNASGKTFARSGFCSARPSPSGSGTICSCVFAASASTFSSGAEIDSRLARHCQGARRCSLQTQFDGLRRQLLTRRGDRFNLCRVRQQLDRSRLHSHAVTATRRRIQTQGNGLRRQLASKGSRLRCAVRGPRSIAGFRHSLSLPRPRHRRSDNGCPEPKTSPVPPPESPDSSTARRCWPAIPGAAHGLRKSAGCASPLAPARAAIALGALLRVSGSRRVTATTAGVAKAASRRVFCALAAVSIGSTAVSRPRRKRYLRPELLQRH